MLIRLTHRDPNYTFYVESDQIDGMERYIKQKSIIITANDGDPDVTAVVMRNGRIWAVRETPEQIIEIIEKAKANV